MTSTEETILYSNITLEVRTLYFHTETAFPYLLFLIYHVTNIIVSMA